VRSTAASAISNLNTQHLLPIFLSKNISHPTYNPIIFQHLINQSIPLYLVEQSLNNYRIHISETSHQVVDSEQIQLLTQRLHGGWKKAHLQCKMTISSAPTTEEPKERNCIVS